VPSTTVPTSTSAFSRPMARCLKSDRACEFAGEFHGNSPEHVVRRPFWDTVRTPGALEKLLWDRTRPGGRVRPLRRAAAVSFWGGDDLRLLAA
jgi:hypothetical protein